jgi:hypothetical protein
LRALSFDPRDRFQNARELGDALHRSLTEETASFDPPRRDPAPIPATQVATDANAASRQTADLSSKTIAARFEPAPVNKLSGSNYPAIENRDYSARRPWLKVGIPLLLLVVVAAAAVVVWKRGLPLSSRGHSLNYSLTVQKIRDGKPFQDEFESSGQEIFENGWKFRMNLSSPNEGYLYLLNEGPAAGDSSTYNMLFPEAKTNNGSARVAAGQKLQTAWMRFDDQQGTERFWIVLSADPVKELEAVTGAVNDQDQGAIKDAAKARSVQDFLQQHSNPKPEVAKDSAKKQTIVKGKGDLLVHFIELEHH